MNLNEMSERAHANSKDKGFWEGQSDPDDLSFIPEKLMLIVSEAAEALEAYRSNEPLVSYSCKIHGRSRTQLRCLNCPGTPLSKPEGVSSELADIVIRAGDLSARLGIDLGRAVEEKMAYNATRARKHGKVC